MSTTNNEGEPSARAVSIDTACALLEISREQFDGIVNMAPAFASQRELDLIKIARALVILLPLPGRQGRWLRAPNSAPLYRGATALSVIESDVDALQLTRQYLEANIYH